MKAKPKELAAVSDTKNITKAISQETSTTPWSVMIQGGEII